MFVKTLLNRVENLKSFVYGPIHLQEAGGDASLIVHVQPRKNGKPICSGCRQPAPQYDRRPESRLFEYVPMWGIRVFFNYRMRRVECPRCGGIRTEEVPWALGKSRITRTYCVFLARWARRLSWSETATIFHTSWDTVWRSVKWVVDWGLERRDLSGIEAIGVDEIAIGKGQNYVTVVYQIDAGARRLLHVGKGRAEAAFSDFIYELGDEVADIRHVCSDMWRPYLNVVRQLLGEAVHVLDRFHIVANLNKALDQVRAAESKELSKKGFNSLKHTKYCFLKNPGNLTPKQKLKLDEVLNLDLKSVRAYLLKESFQSLWDHHTVDWARWYLKKWCARAMRSRLEPIKKFVKSVRRHEDLILNYFEAKKQFSSGVVEGMNRKTNLITRKSYGFRSEEIQKTALFHTLGQLPEPELTHQFC
jgi:transposase